jgi:hypothetical protein
MEGTRCPTGKTGVKRILDAVRNAGASNPVIIAGLDWSDDLSRWMQNVPIDPLERTDPALGSQLIAGFHPYFGLGNRCEMHPPRCWDHEIAPIQTTGYTGPDGKLRTYPVIANELGDVPLVALGPHQDVHEVGGRAEPPDRILGVDVHRCSLLGSRSDQGRCRNPNVGLRFDLQGPPDRGPGAWTGCPRVVHNSSEAVSLSCVRCDSVWSFEEGRLGALL